jgi:hypothetical protein
MPLCRTGHQERKINIHVYPKKKTQRELEDVKVQNENNIQSHSLEFGREAVLQDRPSLVKHPPEPHPPLFERSRHRLGANAAAAQLLVVADQKVERAPRAEGGGGGGEVREGGEEGHRRDLDVQCAPVEGRNTSLFEDTSFKRPKR